MTHCSVFGCKADRRHGAYCIDHVLGGDAERTLIARQSTLEHCGVCGAPGDAHDNRVHRAYEAGRADALRSSGHCDQCGINCQDCLLDELRNERDELRNRIAMLEGQTQS